MRQNHNMTQASEPSHRSKSNRITPSSDPGPCSTTTNNQSQQQPKRISAPRPNTTKQVQCTYHASIRPISTLHLLTHVKAHTLIDRHIGHTLRALEITLDSLIIRLFRNSLKQQPTNTHPLRFRANSNNIAEIVPARIIPDSSLRLGLPLFPDPVPVRAQPAATKVPDIVEHLSEGQGP